MSVFNEIVRDVALHYANRNIQLVSMRDYETICRTLLTKYKRLNEDITCIVNRLNASSIRVKRLQPHV